MRTGSVAEVFVAFLRLGCTSVGGPVAHLGWFRRELVERRRWLGDAEYAELVALCQLLPGPTSSQVGAAIGLRRAGWAGGVAAFAGFTTPSALLMMAAGMAAPLLASTVPQGLLRGLQAAAAAVVIQAVGQMARTLTPDLPRVVLALLSMAAAMALAGPLIPAACIAAGAIVGPLLPGRPAAAAAPGPDRAPSAPSRRHRTASVACATAGLALLVAALALPARIPWALAPYLQAGGLVFGGGHVVLPLLESSLVPSGQVTQDQFMTGYGLVQAMPGPLFTFAAFLGAVRQGTPSGAIGAVLATGAIFAPGLLLVAGALPWWDRLRTAPGVQPAVRGAGAAVVGLLAAALVTPIGVHLLRTPPAALFAAAAAVALVLLRPPAVAFVAGCALLGWLAL